MVKSVEGIPFSFFSHYFEPEGNPSCAELHERMGAKIISERNPSFWSEEPEGNEEVLEAEECGVNHSEQRVGAMDPLILCLNQYKSELHVCGTDPKKHTKGFEAWPNPRLIPKWYIGKEDPNSITKVLKTELILSSQPTECGQELPVWT